MDCINHPDRRAVAVCQKNEAGYCQECCECDEMIQCYECLDPDLYCKYRTQCLIWELTRERRKIGHEFILIL